MILPSKHLPEDRALLTVGADVLRLLREPKTVSALWHEVKQGRESERPIGYDWFVLALDLLFAMGVVDFERGKIKQTREPADPKAQGEA